MKPPIERVILGFHFNGRHGLPELSVLVEVEPTYIFIAFQVALYVEAVMHHFSLRTESFAEVFALSGSSCGRMGKRWNVRTEALWRLWLSPKNGRPERSHTHSDEQAAWP